MPSPCVVYRPQTQHSLRLSIGASPYFADLPSYDAESGSLAFRPRHFLSLPSDPAVTSNALASRIVFPLVKGDPAFFQAGGFLGFAKQTKKAHVLRHGLMIPIKRRTKSSSLCSAFFILLGKCLYRVYGTEKDNLSRLIKFFKNFLYIKQKEPQF